MKIFRFFLALYLVIVFSQLSCLSSHESTNSFNMNKFENEILIPRKKCGHIDPWSYLDVDTLSAKDGHSPIDYYEDFLNLISEERFLNDLSHEEMDDVVRFLIFTLSASTPRSDENARAYYQHEVDALMSIIHDEAPSSFGWYKGSNDEKDDNSIFYFIGRANRRKGAIMQQNLCFSKNMIHPRIKEGSKFNVNLQEMARWAHRNKQSLLSGATVVLACKSINKYRLDVDTNRDNDSGRDYDRGGRDYDSGGNSGRDIGRDSGGNSGRDSGKDSGRGSGRDSGHSHGFVDGSNNVEIRSQGYIFCLTREIEVLRKSLTSYPLEISSEMECWKDRLKNTGGFSRSLVSSISFDLIEEVGSSMKLREDEKSRWRQNVIGVFGG